MENKLILIPFMKNPRGFRRFVIQLGLAICGALLYGGITYLASTGPFTIEKAIFIGGPTSLLLACTGSTELPSDSFFYTVAFLILVNAVIGGIIGIVAGRCYSYVIGVLNPKGNHEN